LSSGLSDKSDQAPKDRPFPAADRLIDAAAAS
jgi:hypothetical protein